MAEKDFLESDWRKFRKLVPEWRERYLSAKNKEIVEALTDERKSPTEQFWDANEKMQKIARILVDCLDGHSRSEMWEYLSLMYRHGLICDADLEQFSEPLRQQILRWIEICGGRR